MTNKVSFFKRRIKSFQYAFYGLFHAFFNEFHFKIHFILFLVVILASIYLKINQYEWVLIFIVSFLVFIIEMINSAIERLCDLYTTKKNQKIKIIKDISAGAVLLSALLSIIVGLIIFLPKTIKLFFL